MKTDKPSQRKKPPQLFDAVDARIQIPVATRMKMQMNLKMNSSSSASSSSSSSEDARLLRSGIDQYRSLQHLTTSAARARGSAERAAERGVALMERRQFGAAVPYLTEALDADGGGVGSVKLLHQRGLCHLAAHKFKPAIEDLSRVMQLTPKSAELYAKRGKAYAALGEHHAALLDYNEAISLAATQGLLHDRGRSDGPTSTSQLQLRALYLARAQVYKAMNNISHALEDLGQAESSAGGHRDAELFHARAQLYLQCHQDVLALPDLDRFLELQEEAEESRHFDASGGVGGLAGFGAPPEMEAEPRARMLDVLLERAKLLQRLAQEEDARERKDAELAAVEQGQAANKTPKTGAKLAYTAVPPKPEPYRGLESRRLEKRALQDYSRAIELEASNVETFRLRGEAFVHLARYDEALADFASALELDPHDFQVSMARAKLFRQRGDLKGAVQEVTTVLRVNGFFINGLKLRAQLYEELGAIQDAEKDYSSIIHAHFDKPGIEDAAASGKVTMELASGGTLNLGGHGGKSSNTSGKSGKAGGGGKITSEVAAQALLCRARLRLASEQFDAAEEDYLAILKSFANNMEAQLELQETRERKVAFEERQQREAVAWLEQNADEMDGGGVLNANHTTSGKNKKKKKKKKKKPSIGSATNASLNGKPQPPAGYMLLEDEEELLQQQQLEEQQRIQQQRELEQKQKQRGERKDTKKEQPLSPSRGKDAPEPEQEGQGAEAKTLVEGEAFEQDDTGSAAAMLSEENVTSDKIDKDHEVPPAEEKQADGMAQEIDEKRGQNAAPVVTTPPSIVVANVMTRDEAWESMWDEEADEPLEAGAVRIQIRAQSSDIVEDHMIESASSIADAASSGELERSSVIEDTADLEDTPVNGDDEANDEASGSSDDGKDSQGKAKAVLVDEKYLKKREKQLKKLRASLQRASDERDKSAIDEALARAERKQMSDALQEDIQRARDVLANMAAEAQRLHEALPPAAPTSKPTSESDHGRMHLHTVTPTTSLSNASPGASKPPSLVIRPIAYGQALQVAEQHQQQIRAHQKLLEEKDAEIAELKKLLAQKEQAPTDPVPQEDARSVETRAHAKAAALARRVARLRTQFPTQGAAARQADALIEWMGPSDAADRVRQQVLSFVQRIITAHFPLAAAPLFFATGSYPMKTYLPGSDLDICLLVPQELESSWYYIVTQALCLAGGSGGAGTVLDVGNPGGSVDGSGNSSPSGPASGGVGSVGGALLLTNTVRNVTFINADVRVVKCTVDNIPVDFTANRVGALGAVRLLDAMAVRVGRQHLFKKSLILIKAWCTHESSPFMQAASVESGGLGPSVVPGSAPSSVMGASLGALSTYAVNTIAMALFNQYGDALTHPLQALYLFLDRLAEFPWHESALTLHGAVPLSRLATTPLNGTTPSKSKPKTAKLDGGDVEAIRDTLSDQFGAFDAALRSKVAPTGLFPIRACNIVDPLDDKNNLARSVSAEGFPVMKRAFRLARNQLAAMLAPRSSHKDDDAELLSEETGSDAGLARQGCLNVEFWLNKEEQGFASTSCSFVVSCSTK
ncbi:DNA polymerase sigma [Phytophthora cinnamomi]|uniref:DNA polymerase sigma n=1 Tax=Phytophthora cinnamomi TaxID=4785 RepID=UPI003559406B|nr:DNA polymerase sigma [Phytophthora cinnamomi]